MPVCENKLKHLTRESADAAMQEMTARYRARRSGGESWKRLNVYACPFCGCWHIGRKPKTVEQRPVEKAPAAPAVKQPTFGDLRQRLKRMQADWERHDDKLRRKQAAAVLQRIAAENEIDRIKAERYADLQDSYTQALRIVAALLPETPRG